MSSIFSPGGVIDEVFDTLTVAIRLSVEHLVWAPPVFMVAFTIVVLVNSVANVCAGVVVVSSFGKPSLEVVVTVGVAFREDVREVIEVEESEDDGTFNPHMMTEEEMEGLTDGTVRRAIQ